ncbi:hypothetical protein ACHHYP_06468 [Achlya hypogyna]|uniref:Reverse transcriptase domain-containing protein n=1 Tax=Achlya hypogyna TaxID=1202772 RepID=A0A1V9YTQ8_ACHHY|nr:hypothetical protein ACHHYP_06468 [Achlya hypogyna]
MTEAGAFLDHLRGAPDGNHGARWFGWLKRMKKTLNNRHKVHQAAATKHLQLLKVRLAVAQLDHAWSSPGAATVAVAQAAVDLTQDEHSQHLLDQQFDFHATANEHPHENEDLDHDSQHGAQVSDTVTVQTSFTEHWRRVMTTPRDTSGPNRARRRAVLRHLKKRQSNAERAGDRGDPGNYRPIALMAVEVKILSRALAYHLAKYAPKLVHPTQAGVVPGRRLHDHVLGCPLSCLLFVLYIEPLGDMLREQPHLGMFFADDSTLISSDLPSALEQLAIVEEFCAVSGARLNQAKCMTLALNQLTDPAALDGGGLLNILSTGVPIKYLGIEFSHALEPEHQIAYLNERFLEAFQMWGCRARTLQGRRLIANTVLLSLLWHVTAVTPVPGAMINLWQPMITKYVMCRKTKRGDHYRPLLARRWYHDKSLGLGVPHVQSIIRAQRLRRLQDLMRGPTGNSPLWQQLVLKLFERTMEPLFRATHPWDFLSYRPAMETLWIDLSELRGFVLRTRRTCRLATPMQ